MKSKNLATLFFLILISINWLSAQKSKVVLKTNFKGEVEFGSIDRLISKIAEGKEVRIGWQLDFNDDGKSDLEHWIDGDFITMLNGHVFNQIEPIYRQVPKADIPQVKIINSSMQWTGIIGTNGKLISRYIIPDLFLIENEDVRERMEKTAAIKERMVATIWVVRE